MMEKAVVSEENVAKGRQIVLKVSVLGNEDLRNLVADEKLYK